MPEPSLYCVATPIGNLDDMSRRACQVLAEVDCIYAEDTRVTRQLLSHFGIQNRLVSLHDHNEAGRVAEVLAVLAQGKSMALVSDAGTPLISDPGYHLVGAVTQAGFRVIPVPGPSALIAALSVAGLPTDRFCFEGFLPARGNARRKALAALAAEPRTLVLYESSHRIEALLTDMLTTLGGERQLVLARELTKRFEQVCRGTVEALLQAVRTDENLRRGEFVVMLAGAEPAAPAEQDNTTLLRLLLEEGLSVRQAAKVAARLTGQPRNALYRLATALAQEAP
ncbi:MAG: 16S rRNA (cytidine(1402)-2'-O)-methyltransferase [Thiothrix sp.]|nr:16S rRNA (cytidine(1402)-2'-O)-methyltransferase [Thiothrix sp.]HPQ94408.1 16S rRNA (cytidine(1402)-2'-O)-methyltransferase [Thiolinea sp.]